MSIIRHAGQDHVRQQRHRVHNHEARRHRQDQALPQLAQVRVQAVSRQVLGADVGLNQRPDRRRDAKALGKDKSGVACLAMGGLKHRKFRLPS